MKPVIFVACSHDGSDAGRYFLHQPYADCLAVAGGLPLLLPFLDPADVELALAGAKGVLLPGGIDLDSSTFREEPHPKCGAINPLCDRADLLLARLALRRKLPLFGICRGMQVLNVAAGGGIIQDIESQLPWAVKHQQDAPGWHPSHSVTIAPGSFAAKVLQAKSTAVNSGHHQAVGRLGAGLRATAWAADGVVEALESDDSQFVLGLQWHPERMAARAPNMQRFFTMFVEACANN